ncbi:DUF1810 family protein [Mesorhizobium sp. M0408]
MPDEYDLQRFVSAQDPVYDDALAILRRGMMCTPYMEFIFPRLATRRSGAAPEPYAITSLDEASAYLSFRSSEAVIGNALAPCNGSPA